MTATSPPAPGPAVELAISAPPSTVRLAALTVTSPPDPDCGPVAEAAIPVLALPMPSSSRAPGVVTSTEPPFPVPAVVLSIVPPAVSVIAGALTVTAPPLPLAAAPAKASIALPVSLTVNGPWALTATLPPLPAPSVLELTSAPSTIVIVPSAVSITSPAPPLDPAARRR